MAFKIVFPGSGSVPAGTYSVSQELANSGELGKLNQVLQGGKIPEGYALEQTGDNQYSFYKQRVRSSGQQLMGTVASVMATIAGFAVGSAVLGPVFGAGLGTTIAGAIGAGAASIGFGLMQSKYHQSKSYGGEQVGGFNQNSLEFAGLGSFSYPGMLDHTSMDGQRLDDLSVQSSAYGKVRPIVFGEKRIAGQLIWSKGLRDVKDVSTEADGYVTVTTWKYYVTAMWEVCENEGHRVTAVRRIYLDNKLCFDNSSDSATSIVTDGTFLEWTAGVPDNWTPTGTVTEISTDLDPELSGAVAAAGIYYGGEILQSITIATANVQHRITLRVRSAYWTQVQIAVDGTTLPWLRCPGTGTWSTIQTTWTPTSAGAIDLEIKNLTTPSSTLVVGSVVVAAGISSTGDEEAVDFGIYLGGEDQEVPAIVANNHPWGSEWSPAYVGAVCIGVEDLPLEKYSNRIPKLEAVVEEISETTGDIVERIVEIVSPDTVVDVTELDQEIDGFFINSRVTAERALDPLRLAYQFEVIEDEDGVLVFKAVADRTTSTQVDDGLLDVRPFGTNPGANLSITSTGDEALPNTVDVGFIEADRNQEVGEVHSALFGVNGNTSTSYNFPIVGTSTEFRSIALRLHAIALTERKGYTMRADARLSEFEPTDVIEINGTLIRLQSITLDGFGRLSLAGVYHYPRAYTLTALGATVDVNTTIPAAAL